MDTTVPVTNTWLIVMAIAMALQVLLLVGGVAFAIIVARRVTTTLSQIEQRHVAPISHRVAEAIDDARDVMDRARHIEDAVRVRIERIDQIADSARRSLRHRVWPAIALGRAVAAGARTLTRHPDDTSVPQRAR